MLPSLRRLQTQNFYCLHLEVKTNAFCLFLHPLVVAKCLTSRQICIASYHATQTKQVNKEKTEKKNNKPFFFSFFFFQKAKQQYFTKFCLALNACLFNILCTNFVKHTVLLFVFFHFLSLLFLFFCFA